MSRISCTIAGLLSLLVVCVPSIADEGMWLLNQLPREQLQERYGFEPGDDWIRHVQRSCVRISSGGSASFVSGNGLLMTNHHVASDIIADLSDEKNNYVRDGFYARTHGDELKCPKAELSILMTIEQATDQVTADVTPEMSPAEALAAKKMAMSRIEKEARDRTGLMPEIVELYHGARYDLYLYKRYTDVRLVFAPELGIAFFGGDLDNFEYPRYCLDVAFLRAYEDGKPARTENFLKWSANGARDGELVFIAGHPGRTQRLFTVEHLEFLRDVRAPLMLNAYNQREVALLQFMGRSEEYRRIANEDLLGIQNGRKAYNGILEGLLDEQLMGIKRQAQDKLVDFIQAEPGRQAKYGDAHRRLAEAIEATRADYPAYFLLANRRASLCRLYSIALRLVQAAQEKAKPDGERLDEFRDANLPSLEIDLFSTAPIYDALEQFRLSDGLVRLGRVLGGGHPAVKAALGGVDAQGRAAVLLAGCKLKDVEYRRKLYEGGSTAIAESEDSMIRFARQMEPIIRELRKRYEDQYESVEKEVYGKIAAALFEMQGDKVYPDATFTLRLAYGTIAGYEEPGRSVEAMTTFRGLYKLATRRDNQPPYELPKRWQERKDKLDLSLPFNFVCTNDIIGGNSGSPIFNKNAEVVGIVFDGNIHGLIWDFQFDMKRARAVGVHSRAITEALEKVYDAGPLVSEILGR